MIPRVQSAHVKRISSKYIYIYFLDTNRNNAVGVFGLNFKIKRCIMLSLNMRLYLEVV